MSTAASIFRFVGSVLGDWREFPAVRVEVQQRPLEWRQYPLRNSAHQNSVFDEDLVLDSISCLVIAGLCD